jgi:hypothetical protein
MLNLTLNLNAIDVTALVEALEVIKRQVSIGVTTQSDYDYEDSFSYDFEVVPAEDEAEDPEYDYDGQPDEAQEWHDFNPDA